MKVYKFYLEHNSHEESIQGSDAGTVLAVDPDTHQARIGYTRCVGTQMGARAHILPWLHLPDCYLEDNCREITEQEAREVHPELLQYLENEHV